MLPPADRLQGAQLHRYIRDHLYWMLHAPRQTGKTTFLQSWMREINAGNEAISCYVSVERCQEIVESERAMPAICDAVCEAAAKEGLPVPELTLATSSSANSLLSSILSNWAVKVAPKPLVILFDEVDVLEGETMISFLRQLRGGFATRGVGNFPTSIALVGMRDLKDYLVAAKDGKTVNPGSPFNIKEDSTVIGNFSKNNVTSLFAQRTEETGQQITSEALDYVWEQSSGQPWIVNSLFKRATMRVLDEDSRETVKKEHILAAREQMILARETHFDALAWRMRDPNIHYVMETLLTGQTDLRLAQNEGFRQCLDLGLVTNGREGATVANPIYREVLAREISLGAQIMLPPPSQFRWQKPDGSLDMESLLREFQKFWRRHSEIWEQTSDYTEAFPHLLLMAFLQRITNGEGRIEREYAAGRGRLDLFVEFAEKTFIIEVKLIRDYDSLELVKEEGLEQILSYRDKFDKSIPCYLLIFDRRSEGKKLDWEHRITWEVKDDGVTILGC
jgi:ASC-1-like (ASCH) protein